MSVAPVFSDIVDQQFFIEALGGSQQPVSYLDRFPDTVYSKAIDSVLVTFLYALLGPAGAGSLRESYLEARLQFENAGLATSDLDAAYSNPFAFARAALETYTVDASASLLPSQTRAQILSADSSFRNRAVQYFKAIRAGGTLQGLSLAAQSGLNHPVDVIENYRALFDQYTDMPLGLPYMGTTSNLSEVIIVPRQDIPQNAAQTIVLNGEPTSGWFTLSVPLGPNYRTIKTTVTNGSTTVTVPNSARTPVGTYLTIATISNYTYAQVGSIVSPTSVSLVSPPQTTGQSLTAMTSGTYTAYVGNAQTVPLPYNASYSAIQAALWALPVIGPGNVQLTGGPLPDRPVEVDFTNALADQPIPQILVNSAPDIVVGIGGANAVAPLVSELSDVTKNPLTISSTVTVDRVGTSADSQTATIPPQNQHNMEVALDRIRPVTSIITTQPAQAVTQRQKTNTIFAGSSYTEVLRYETGKSAIRWPAIDQTHWIEGGKEHEAPHPVGDLNQHYQGFHNVSAVTAYTEGALGDAGYGSGATQVSTQYWNTMIGVYSQNQIALYPFLDTYQDPNAQFSPTQALAASPDPLVITDNVNGGGVINGVYPVDYLAVSGVPQLSSTPTFWASAERAPVDASTPSADYLEIDLGTVQAINYIYFEATNKPYLISASYDMLDQSPARNFIPVTPMPATIAPSVSNLVYDATQTNPWSVVELHFTNALNQMVFTRFIRLEFTRNPVGTPFQTSTGQFLQYSIEVRNVRLGRNLASPLDRTILLDMRRTA